jgi:hypothetical protein
VDYSLCRPHDQLSCFACCPPLRPAGYDHADHRPSLRRLLSDNRAAFLAGQIPDRPMTGFFCPGLGFLDARGRLVGCLLHPARNQGRDLRSPTGYAEKCSRESCPEARAFALLPPSGGERLIRLCQGMDSFVFSSRRLNPVMALLALGPETAGAAAQLHIQDVEQLRAWPWLGRVPPALGWLLGRLLQERGPEALLAPDLERRLTRAADRLARRLGPRPPAATGRLLNELCDEWEARLWRDLSGSGRALPGRLARMRKALEGLFRE